MLFNSIPFLVLFSILFVVHRSVPTPRRQSVLLVGSLVFYGMWLPVYLLLFLTVLIVSYWLLRQMQSSPRPKAWLLGSNSRRLPMTCSATSEVGPPGMPFTVRLIPGKAFRLR